jgi:hypothetical protein
MDETDFGDLLISEEELKPAGLRGGRADVVNIPTPIPLTQPVPRYSRTGDSAEVLAYQCGIRLLRGESWVSIESSLAARGVGDVDRIMEMAATMALGKR